jgi:hypothetical protein
MQRILTSFCFVLAACSAGCGPREIAQQTVPIQATHAGDSSDIQNLITELEQWPDRRAQWKAQLGEHRETDRAADDLLAKHDPYSELDELLHALIPLFLTVDNDTRDRIRKIVGDQPALADQVRGYAARAAFSIHHDGASDMYRNVSFRGDVPVNASDDNELFRHGVGALAMEDCCDYRESLTTLAELCIRAEKAGVQPRQHLEQLADVFSNKPVGGFGKEFRPYREVVRDFRKSK